MRRGRRGGKRGPYNRPSCRDHIQERVLQWVYPERNNNFYPHQYRKLPGPLPHTIQRKDFEGLEKNEYWVTEKSNGERFMMLIDPEVGVFLINRKFEKRPHVLPNESEITQSVLLDGEYFSKSNTFLIFDIVMMNNKSCVNDPFSRRLSKIKEFVEHVHFPRQAIRLKTFVDKSQLRVLLERIKEGSDGKFMYQSDDGQINESDGFIFVAENENYLHNRGRSLLLKWKWKGLNTLDFRVVRKRTHHGHSSKIGLAAGGYENTGDIVMKEIDEKGVSFELLVGQIVECSYSKNEGRWVPEQIRHDKRFPNHVTTVMSTMETLIDDITIEEILKIVTTHFDVLPNKSDSESSKSDRSEKNSS